MKFRSNKSREICISRRETAGELRVNSEFHLQLV